MWAYLDTVVKGKVMDNEKEIVWTDDMGFMPPVRRTEGRTICRYECQLTEYKAEIEQLRKDKQHGFELMDALIIRVHRLRQSLYRIANMKHDEDFGLPPIGDAMKIAQDALEEE